MNDAQHSSWSFCLIAINFYNSNQMPATFLGFYPNGYLSFSVPWRRKSKGTFINCSNQDLLLLVSKCSDLY